MIFHHVDTAWQGDGAGRNFGLNLAGMAEGEGALAKMQADGVHRRIAGVLLGAIFLLGACADNRHSTDGSDGVNAYPTNYKSDILAAMHAYLDDPTGIRESEISEPAQKQVGGLNRYVTCLRFNGKRRGNEYAGVKEIAAVFIAGRFDRFLDTARELCAGASYAPFPELGKLSR
ncbi:MAG TPA: hypothetical protein VK430_11165 [Xanthobacteraceae bacterium]|nr:hypothetical protein [Xanthobacteraceae bacterium]